MLQNKLENKNPLNPKKFQDPHTTLDGKPRAHIKLETLETLWVNTGTLCNIECKNCYIFSSPTNDRLVYIKTKELIPFLDEIKEMGEPTKEIGFTGGEVFMNPDMLDMAQLVLSRGFSCLLLTNAMRPMQRRKIKEGLTQLAKTYPSQLKLRVSLDHYTQDTHDQERGLGSFSSALLGLSFLAKENIPFNLAARKDFSDETEAQIRQGFTKLAKTHHWQIDPNNPKDLILFPEMELESDVPEITTQCWDILDVRPQNIMCATSRMLLKRKGAEKPSLVACTLLPDDTEFELGKTLREAKKQISLNHPHCARFCVLGGGDCAA